MDFAVSSIDRSSLEAFQEFSVANRDGFTPNRIVLHRCIDQCLIDPSRKTLLQPIEASNDEGGQAQACSSLYPCILSLSQELLRSSTRQCT